MVCTLQRYLDPLDLEIVEKVLQSFSERVGAGSPTSDMEGDEELERALRCELAEIVRASGVSHADVLLDILITGMSGPGKTAPLSKT